MAGHAIAIAVVCVIVLAIIVYNKYGDSQKEGYMPCYGQCDFPPLPKGGLVQINPFVWPYSAYADPDAAYMSPSANIQVAPLTHQSTPDHVLLTN